MVSNYDIHEHSHRFAAWAAARASSTITCRFKVSNGKHWIESVSKLYDCRLGVDHLPTAKSFDAVHKSWRRGIIAAAQESGFQVTHGIAAKLINVYLKAVFVHDTLADNQRVQVIHPPIDRLLIDELARAHPELWRGYPRAWSKFSSLDYEKTISLVRKTLGNEHRLWCIEKYWFGSQ